MKWSGLLLTAQQRQSVAVWAQMAEQVADSRVGAASTVLLDGRTLIVGGAEQPNAEPFAWTEGRAPEPDQMACFG
jgi:hypothetical protein